MFRLVCVLLVVLLSYQLMVQATNSPNILSREDTPNCVDGCSKRTMFSIVWGCVSTTIICAWAAVHPNIPPREGPVKATLRRLELMLWTIIAPEGLPCWALNQLFAAKEIKDLYNSRKGYTEESFWTWKTVRSWFSFYEITAASNPAWSVKHGHFMIMGGIRLVEPKGKSTTSSEDGIGQALPAISIAKLSRSVKVDTETGRAPAGNKASAKEGRVTILTLEMLNELLKDDDFEIHVTEDEIEDRSKGDGLSKIIFMLQSSWFILQCIERHVQGLNLTQLELTTLAIASLNAITIILWWDKPLGVQTPVYVYMKRQLTDAERNVNREIGVGTSRSHLLSRLIKAAKWFQTLRHRTKASILLISIPCIIPLLIFIFVGLFFASANDLFWHRQFSADATSVSTLYVPKHQYFDKFWHIKLSLILGPLFGGIHCVGWNFHFPTVIQRQLWRVASLFVTTLPIIIILMGLIASVIVEALSRRYIRRPEQRKLIIRSRAMVLSTFPFNVLYVAARIVLLGQAIALLRHQPPSSFIAVDWTKFYPHFL